MIPIAKNPSIESIEPTKISSTAKFPKIKNERPKTPVSNVYSKRKESTITSHVPIFDLVTGNENETQAFDTNNDLNLPIVIRKGIRSCPHHLISQFVFFFFFSIFYLSLRPYSNILS